MMNSNAELRLDLESQTLVAQPQTQPALKDLAKVKHIFSPGVYIKAFFVPKNTGLVTKSMHDDHVTILAQGSVIIEDQGQLVRYVAPATVPFKKHTRYRVRTEQDSVWYCVHPTQETDQAVVIDKYK